YWKHLEHDIMAAVKEFFASGTFPSGCNSSFIALIPKIHDAKVVKDYRPISLFSGIPIDSSLTLSHIFFADDAIFVGSEEVDVAATTMGCSTFTTLFVHLGVKVGGSMSCIKSWNDVVAKVSPRLSKWKLKTLLIGGRLTLIKSVLTSIPLYHMSSFKVPSGVLKLLESIRRNLFNGMDGSERKMAWISWNKVLASKKYGGLGISGFYALNRALLFKWVWHFFSHGSCQLGLKGFMMILKLLLLRFVLLLLS
ncbi:hypothetical protein Tco_1567621, partial [Tanacetum coccineum]